MKKLIPLLSVLGLLFFASCSKEDNGTPVPVPETPQQNAVVFHFGGTWNSPEGEYGKPGKEWLLKNYVKKVCVVSCQMNATSGGFTDPMSSADGNQMSGFFKQLGPPSMFLMADGGVLNLRGNTITQNMLKSIVDSMTTKITPRATVSATVTKTNLGSTWQLKVDAKVKFHVAIPGKTYLLGAYFVENDLYFPQQNDNGDNTDYHEMVMREKLCTALNGDLLASNPAKDLEVSKTITKGVNNSYNMPKCKIVLVIWEKTGTTINWPMNGLVLDIP